MTQYAQFDHTQPAPQRVIGWYDTILLEYPTMPPAADLLEVTEDEWNGRMENPSAWAVQGDKLVPYVAPPLPPPTLQQQAQALLNGPVTLECTSIPALNGDYPIDAGARQQMTTVIAGINAGIGLPSGTDTFNWPDVNNDAHQWPAPQFVAFGRAVTQFYYQAQQVATGHSEAIPSSTLRIA